MPLAEVRHEESSVTVSTGTDWNRKQNGRPPQKPPVSKER